MPAPIVIADSITRVGPEATGAVVVNASHGGVYAAYLAAKLQAAAAIFNDASVGRDGADLMARGRISHVNAAAAALGCAPGQRTPEAAALLAAAPLSEQDPPAQAEARHAIAGVAGWLLDSNGVVRPDDAGTIVVTGSHGGLLGGRPATAIRVDAFAAVYNDAGGGIDDAGFSRLPALDARAIAGATVDAFSARIGDARSTYDDGVLSRVNQVAARHGAAAGMRCTEFVALMERARRKR